MPLAEGLLKRCHPHHLAEGKDACGVGWLDPDQLRRLGRRWRGRRAGSLARDCCASLAVTT